MHCGIPSGPSQAGLLPRPRKDAHGPIRRLAGDIAPSHPPGAVVLHLAIRLPPGGGPRRMRRDVETDVNMSAVRGHAVVVVAVKSPFPAERWRLDTVVSAGCFPSLCIQVCVPHTLVYVNSSPNWPPGDGRWVGGGGGDLSPHGSISMTELAPPAFSLGCTNQWSVCVKVCVCVWRCAVPLKEEDK